MGTNDRNYEITNVTVNIDVHVLSTKYITPLDIYKAEEHFVVLRDKTSDKEAKKQFDTCRAILKWAGTCGAKLKHIISHSDHFTFTLIFDYNSFKEFSNFFEMNVEGSIVSTC